MSEEVECTAGDLHARRGGTGRGGEEEEEEEFIWNLHTRERESKRSVEEETEEEEEEEEEFIQNRTHARGAIPSCITSEVGPGAVVCG